MRLAGAGRRPSTSMQYVNSVEGSHRMRYVACLQAQPFYSGQLQVQRGDGVGQVV